MTYQFAKQSVTVKIPGLKEMKERDLEMQKQISQLTNTVTKLSEQIATLSARPIPAAAPAAPRVVPALPQQRQKPPTTTKPPPGPAPTYAQVAEKQLREFTEVRSKKKARKETILPKPYPTADRLTIFSIPTAANDRKEAADRALQVANKTITTHADIEHPPLILANITATNNLVFTVAHQHLLHPKYYRVGIRIRTRQGGIGNSSHGLRKASQDRATDTVRARLGSTDSAVPGGPWAKYWRRPGKRKRCRGGRQPWWSS